ncbi:antiviral innate immune response receptor RIG-I [Heteronotia binoei]|uniref:antiviral innate immune response receptor RIG-I n=1 Tax=Heteronotia binoei TaxID=13085 RepID=UPI00292FD97D|nr:antiviral innate immune response receptor RIG-I [Heteronotia binoei]
MSQEEKQSLLSFASYIEKTLNPKYILPYMKGWLTDEDVEKIQTEGQKSPTAAARVFLQIIVNLTEDGWFRGFLDALSEAGYHGLYEAICSWDFSMIEKLEQYRQLLRRIEPSLRQIEIEQLFPFLPDCILDQEWEEIKQVRQNNGKAASALKLADCLYRSDKTNWPKTFQLALEQTNYAYISWNLTDDQSNVKDVEMTDEDEDSCAVDINVQYTEDAEPANYSENACSALTSPAEPSQQPTYFPKKARSYQNELAQPALNGKNTIICAPTGSGKTFVSLMICDYHLHNRPAGAKGKVVFLATKVPVYEQQKEVFQEHFERTSYSVAGICGETAANTPVAMVIEGNDITVMTPQILVNCLNDGTLPSLSMFTLMIFDECHNTTGNHPYNVLMSKYLDLKFEHAETPLPQIVGLTASLGVGSAKNLEETIEHICTVCASLSAQVISTVKENTKDLEEVVWKPKKSIKLIEKRPQSCFVDIISHMMSETEDLAKKIYPIDTLSHIKCRSFGTQKYEQWIVDVQKRCSVLQLPDKEKESRICRALFIYTEHLRRYNDTLIINEDARTQDALAYLKEFFVNIRSGGFDEIEEKLASNFEDKLPEMNAISQDEYNENPKLEELTFILEEEYRLKPQTRSILFVKTRALAAALKNWIEESPQLKHLKPDVLMGRGKRNQNTGMTLPNQKGVLNSFKSNGDSKLLIATSVADEGIDIAQCNLVLLYEYTGNVIKMIQVRGRGRAKDSKCILVTSKRDRAETEKNNMLKEELMNKAIEKLQKWDEATLAQKINDLQMRLKQKQDSKKKESPQKAKAGSRKLLCRKCKKFACDSEDIRVIEGAHHTVINENFRQLYITRPHEKARCYSNFEKRCKLYCSDEKCQHDWGITVRYMTLDDLPIIKVESFIVQDVVSGTQHLFRKWKDVDFAMKAFAIEEMSR